MDKQIVLEKLEFKIKEYAKGRKSDVVRGAETPRLAALLLQKYGIGIIEAVAAIYCIPETTFQDNPRITDQLYEVLDEEVSQIDPDWKEHATERWAKRPADLNI